MINSRARRLACLTAVLVLAVPGAGALAATPVAAAKASSSGTLSTPAIVAVALAAVLALGCLAWALARSQAYQPRWVASLRHSLAEAGLRASSTWAEFGDWARLGR